MDSSISMQCRHSSNTWDRYHIACTVNDREHSFSDPPINNRYLTVELNARESWMNTSFDEDGVRDYEYHWRVSLWDSSTERMSGDAFIDVAARSSPAADCVYLLELTNATIVPSQRYYLYVDLIPRASGIPVASGSYDVTSVVMTSVGIASGGTRRGGGTASSPSGWELQQVSIDLLFSRNIKDWPTIRGYSYDTNSANSSAIRFNALVGYLESHQRYSTTTTQQIYASSSNTVISPRMIAKSVPSHTIGVLDYLRINSDLLARIRRTPHQSQLSPTAASALLSPVSALAYSSISSPLNSFDPMMPSSSSPASSQRAAWSCHVTLLDLQLSPDILDLYADRSIVVTAGCGGQASFTAQTYLGHIASYMGSFVERAEVVGPTLVDFVSLESKIYRSCLHVEVKVVEDSYCCIPQQQQQQDASSTSRTSATRSGLHAVSKAASMSSFVLCTGLLQKDKDSSDLLSPLSPNGSSSDISIKGGSIYDKYMQLMDISSSVSSFSSGIASLDDVSSVDTLDTGEYDVLLHTSYNPTTQLDAQLVGTARVRVEINGENRLRACVHQLQRHPSLHKEMDDLIYLCNDDSQRRSHFHRCWDELTDCMKFLHFAAHTVDNSNRLMTAHREVMANKSNLSPELVPLQTHINNMLVVHSNQRNKLFGAMGFVLATIGRTPTPSATVDIVVHLVDSISSTSSPVAAGDLSAAAGLLSLMLVVQKYFQDWLTSDVVRDLMDRSASAPSSSSRALHTFLLNSTADFWESIQAATVSLSMMKILYDMEGRRAGDGLLERTMRRELLFDRRALEDMMEDLSCSILGYLTQGIISTYHHLDADPSTVVQHMVQTSSALHAGIHAITRILPTDTAATGGLVDNCLVDFITSFVEYLSMVTTRPSATIGMLPVHTRVQLVSILVQCVRIVAGRLRPTEIRTLGGTSDKQAAAATLVSQSTAADGAVLLTGLDAVTSFLLKQQQQQQSSNRTCMLLLIDDDSDDARRKLDLFCTLHECIMILNGSISSMLQHHHNIIAPSLGDHRDAMGRSIKSGGKKHSYPQPTTSKRVAAHSFAAPSIADQRSTTIHTCESSRDDDHPYHPHRNQHHHHLHHHHRSSELEAPYRGTMVLYFLYENRRYLDCLRRFVGSVLAFQSHSFSSSASSSCGIPLKHGVLSSAASIERLLLSVANSVSGGVVSLSHFSSMLLVTNMINLTSLKDVYPPHLLLLSAVDFISSMQGIVLQCVETARCEVLLRDDNTDHHHQMILSARIDAVETAVESQMNFLSLLARVCRTESLMHPDAVSLVFQSKSFLFGEDTAAMSKSMSPLTRSIVFPFPSGMTQRDGDGIRNASSRDMINGWFLLRRSTIDTLLSACSHLVGLHTSGGGPTSVEEDRIDSLFLRSTHLVCETILLSDIAGDRWDIIAASFSDHDGLLDHTQHSIRGLLNLVLMTPRTLLHKLNTGFHLNTAQMLIESLQLSIDASPADDPHRMFDFLSLQLDSICAQHLTHQLRTHGAMDLLPCMEAFFCIDPQDSCATEEIFATMDPTLKNDSQLFIQELLHRMVAQGDAYPRIAAFSLAYAMRLTAISLYASSKQLVLSVQQGPSIVSSTNAVRVEMATIICSAALSHQIIYSYSQRHSIATAQHLTGLIDELTEMFRKYQINWQTQSMHGPTDKPASSCVLMHMGFAHRAYQSVMRLLMHRIVAEASVAGTPSPSSGGVAAAGHQTMVAEAELQHLRVCLQTMLLSGHWEVGKQLANAYLDRYRSMNNDSAPPSPSLSQAVGGTSSPPIRPPTVAASISNSGSPTAASFHHSSNPPSRQAALKAELTRMMDEFQSKINHDGSLRLPGQYYALRLVSHQPWQHVISEQAVRVLRCLPHLQCDLQLLEHPYSFTMPSSSHQTTATGGGGGVMYQYWIILHFDATSYTSCAEHYDNISKQEERRLSNDFSGVGSTQWQDLSSPIAYHSIQRQLSMAFPEFMMLSSHHMLESYLARGIPSSSSSSTALSINYMQLYEALPADLCDDIHLDKVIDAIDPIEDDQSVSHAADDDAEDSDGGSEQDPSLEAKDDQPLLLPTDPLDDLLSSQCYQSPDSAGPVKYYVYAILSEEEFDRRNHQEGGGGAMMLSPDRYINRFSLEVGRDCVHYYSHLGSKGTHSRLTNTDMAYSILNASSINPVNIAINTCNSSRSIVDSILETLYYYFVSVRLALKALRKLSEFSVTELANEPQHACTNSSSVFFGVFTMLCNVLETPAASCINLSCMESMIISEQERLESDWQRLRKETKRKYMRDLAEYSAKLKASAAEVEIDSTYEELYESISEPEEPDFELLKTHFESQQHYHSLFIAHQLFGKTEQTILDTMKELRAVAVAADLRQPLSAAAASASASTTGTRLDRVSQESLDRMQDTRSYDPRTLRHKLCLYLEALYYAREVGVAI